MRVVHTALSSMPLTFDGRNLIRPRVYWTVPAVYIQLATNFAIEFERTPSSELFIQSCADWLHSHRNTKDYSFPGYGTAVTSTYRFYNMHYTSL